MTMTKAMGIILYQFTEEQFKDLLNTVRIATVEELSKKASTDKFLTKQEAANYLRIHVSTLDERLRKHTLPLSLRHYNGGTIYFSQLELEAFIKKS